jgi:7-carboxy-7-deazaguanine synthase
MTGKKNEKGLLLVNNGIFPIVFDENGNRFKDKTQLDSDMPGTIQGEGLFAGSPSLFMRLSGCNLRCLFTSSEKNGIPNRCDTWYSSFEAEKNMVSFDSAEAIVRNNIKKGQHLVISGGEPFLQAGELCLLLDKLIDLELVVTVETNGTIYHEELAKRVTLISISPKLSNSTPTVEKCDVAKIDKSEKLFIMHEKTKANLLPIKQYIDLVNETSGLGIQLKFVVTSERDIKEIKKNYLNNIKEIEPYMIYLMPEGITQEEMKKKSKWVINQCVKENFMYCPRLHIEIYGEEREV